MYRVRMTDHAIEQMQGIVDYISNTLMQPEEAVKWAIDVKE